MKTFLTSLLTLAAMATFAADAPLADIPLKTLKGDDTSLKAHAGKVVLIVNVASECGYTPQYAGLEALYQKHKDAGLVVLGFPCNDFGGQEPGTSAEIGAFCKANFGVTFPMFEKVKIKGSDAHPLFAALQAQGKAVGWNFCKFLLGKDGKMIAQFDSGAEPDGPELSEKITAALK